MIRTGLRSFAHATALVLAGAWFGVGCTDKTPAAPAQAPISADAVKASRRALEVPQDKVWAASAHLRIVDVAAGQVVGAIQLQKAIEDLAFTSDGRRAFVAASDGVRLVDVETTKVVAQLTTSPARQLALSPDGKTVGVLEHDVAIGPNGVRTPSLFRWKTLDAETGRTVGVETVGDRVLGVAPGYGRRASAIMFESGEIGLVAAGQPLASQPKAVDLARGIEPLGKSTLTPRPYLALAPDGTKAWMPVEGLPSRILELDLEHGSTRSIGLGEGVQLRGLALSPDGQRMIVTASKKLFYVDLATARVLGQVELGGAHIGGVFSPDGRRAYLAQTIHEKGGAITVVELDPLRVQGKIHIDDISPWVIGLVPRSAVASR